MESGPDKILVGVDRSEEANRALRWALQEGRFRQAPVEVLGAWSYLDQKDLTGEDFDASFGDEQAAAALHEIVAPEQADHEDVTVEERVVCELPGRALVDASRDAAMVVVGARGLGAIRGRLLGSVSDHVVHHSHCPVVVVRKPD
jgi:nucleotide-binding universal stress UspA family protein